MGNKSKHQRRFKFKNRKEADEREARLRREYRGTYFRKRVTGESRIKKDDYVFAEE